MNITRWLVGLTAVAGALALTSGEASAGRFSAPYAGSNAYGATTCYYENIYTSCPTSGGQALQLVAPGTCDECYNQGGSWDGYQCTRYTCYQAPNYIYSTVAVDPGDIILWSDTGQFSLAQLTTNALFTSASSETLRIHAGACLYSSNGTCTSIWNSTAFLDPVVQAANACNSGSGKGKCVRRLRKNIANMLTHLAPGLLTVAPMSHPEVSGPPTIFKALDGTMKTAAINNMNSHMTYGGSNWLYSLGAYSEYTPYGMCAEAVRAAYGLYTSEGAGGTCIPVDYVNTLAHGLHQVFFNIVRHGKATMNGNTIALPGYSGLPGKARFLISQGGRDGVSTALANAVVNAFMNRPERQDSSPFGINWGPISVPGTIHAISNVTSPMNIYMALKYGTVTACMSNTNNGGYAGDVTGDDVTPDDDARNNAYNGGATEYGYQGENYNFQAALANTVVSPSLAGYCSGGQKCEADSDCWPYGGTGAICNFANSSGSQYYSASNTNSDNQYYSTANIYLQAGQQLDIGTCGTTNSNFSGDTYLRLKLSGVEKAYNDDNYSGVGSRIVYTVPTTGTYTVQLGCYSSNSCSGTVAWNIQ